MLMMIFYRSQVSRRSSSTSSVPDVVALSPLLQDSTKDEGEKTKLSSPGLFNGGGAVPNLLDGVGAPFTD